METWRFIDKSTWPPGPWQDEPDKAQWVDAASGLDCMAVRNSRGAWCGYVGVPETHILADWDYDEVDALVTVHGGITYAEPSDEDQPPMPRRPEWLYWFGFHCEHVLDLVPLDLTYDVPAAQVTGLPIAYRTLAYVVAECQQLALQLMVIEATAPP